MFMDFYLYKTSIFFFLLLGVRTCIWNSICNRRFINLFSCLCPQRLKLSKDKWPRVFWLRRKGQSGTREPLRNRGGTQLMKAIGRGTRVLGRTCPGVFLELLESKTGGQEKHRESFFKPSTKALPTNWQRSKRRARLSRCCWSERMWPRWTDERGRAAPESHAR